MNTMSSCQLSNQKSDQACISITRLSSKSPRRWAASTLSGKLWASACSQISFGNELATDPAHQSRNVDRNPCTVISSCPCVAARRSSSYRTVAMLRAVHGTQTHRREEASAAAPARPWIGEHGVPCRPSCVRRGLFKGRRPSQTLTMWRRVPRRIGRQSESPAFPLRGVLGVFPTGAVRGNECGRALAERDSAGALGRSGKVARLLRAKRIGTCQQQCALFVRLRPGFSQADGVQGAKPHFALLAGQRVTVYPAFGTAGRNLQPKAGAVAIIARLSFSIDCLLSDVKGQ